MKLALHRSITFWSGLLVMGFICWAWWDSWEKESYAEYKGLRVDSEYGALWIRHWPYVTSAVGRGTHPYPGVTTVEPRFLALPYLGAGSQGKYSPPSGPATPIGMGSYINDVELMLPYGSRFLYLPYPFVISLVAMPWVALLGCKVRRKGRIALLS